MFKLIAKFFEALLIVFEFPT